MTIPLRRRHPCTSLAVRLIVLALALFTGTALGQNFSADRYYQQCLRFEIGGDLETAQRSCENALQVDPNYPPARLALSRIEVRLGEYARAEPRLRALRTTIDSPEPDLLLAEIALDTGRGGEVDGFIRNAEQRLEEEFNRELAARLNYVEGRLAASRGLYSDALVAFQQAIAFDGLDVTYRLADAALRLELGDAAGARDQLIGYQNLAGTDRNPTVKALLGRSYWALGDIEAATDAINDALTLRTSRQTEAQVADLQALSLIYYGQGNLRSGGVALRGAAQRGNLLQLVLSNVLLWVLLLLVLFAVLLVGESRIATTSTLEVIEGPQPWSVGEVYRILFGSMLLAGLAAVGYGYLVYDNLLSLLTPVQGPVVRGIALIVLSLALTLFTVRRVQRNGWDAGEVLLAGGHQLALGFGAGLLMLAATVAYLMFRPEVAWLGNFYLDFASLPLTVIVAAVLLPLIELHLRAFAFPAFERRYDTLIASVLSVGLYALVLGTPILLLLAFGAVLVFLYQRSDGGLPPLVAQMVLHVGLVLAVTFLPWVRALFV